MMQRQPRFKPLYSSAVSDVYKRQGGHSDEHILETINAGANCLSYTPRTSPEILEDIMIAYRDK